MNNNPASILFDVDGYAIGVETNPLRVDPTGSTTQPVSDGGGSLTVDVGAELPSGTNTIGAVRITDGVDFADIIDVDTTVVSGHKGLVTNALIHGKSSNGGGTFVDVKVSPSGALQVSGDVIISDGGGSITVDGYVTAGQAGTWNINDITGVVSLPTGAATESTLSTLATEATLDTLALRGVVDTGNSSSITLGAGATFTGVAVDISAFSSVVLACKTDRDGYLYAEFSPDGSNWDSILQFTVAADTNEVHRLSVSRKFFRVRMTNTSVSSQTYLRLQTLHGTQPALTSPLDSTVQSDADSVISRSIIMGQTDGGQWKFMPVTSEGHMEVAIHAPRLPFGSIHVENLLPVFQADAVYGINILDDLTTVSGSGTATATDSMFVVSTGTTVLSQGIMQSQKRLRYRAGQGSIMRWAGLFSTPVANSYQVAGAGHAEDGFYFGYVGTEFGILYVNRGVRATYTLTVSAGAATAGNVTVTLNGVAYTVAVTNANNIQRLVWELSRGTYSGWHAHPRGATVVFVRDAAGTTPGAFTYAAGATGSAASFAQTKAGAASTDTFIGQSDWNCDVLDGSRSTRNPSGILLNPLLNNIYQINMQYLGTGAVSFYIELAPDSINNPTISCVHTIRFPNSITTTSVGNPSFPFTMAAYSAGSTTDISIKVGSYAGFIEGNKRLNGPRLTYFDIAAGNNSTYTPAFTIFNPRYYANRANQSTINIVGAGLGSKHGEAMTLFLIKNAPLSGNPNFSQYATGSMALWDNSSTAVVPTDNYQIVMAVVIGASGSSYVEVPSDEEITLQPGEWLSACIRTAAANASNVQVVVNTREDQ